ncbi:hypothetical protein Zm00014a_023869 [Zea mays]|uniref:Uncharacterized protein n=1 Tax=Zea mays TaxID=4577 RepID=A0A3L6E413_MAIZE|nr:hypothetical protein Zm00014a_023869 [Zea mays]
MSAIVPPKPLPFLTTLTTRFSLACLPTRRFTQTRCSSAGHRGPAVAATPRPGGVCRVHSPLRSLLLASAAASARTAAAAEDMSDPELRLVLELATDEELMEVEEILYGTRGWRPSYRDVLLRVRKKIGVQCSSKLCTADLEAEIFLHLVNEYSSHQKDRLSFPWDKRKSPNDISSLGANNWKMLTDVVWRIGTKGMESTFLKGGSALTMKTIYESLANRLSGKLLKEATNYKIKKELVKQGLVRAASRYVGLRSVVTFLGPILWGTLLADIVIQMLGTDYARIVQAVYAFAQIRLTRTSYVESDGEGPE